MTLVDAIAQVARLYPGFPLVSPCYGTDDGMMPYHLLLTLIARTPATLALQRLNWQRALLMAQPGEQAVRLQTEALDEAYPLL